MQFGVSVLVPSESPGSRASGQPPGPTPTGGPWQVGGCVDRARRWEAVCGVLAAPPTPLAGAEACRASLWARSPPWTRRSSRPTRRLPLPFPLGVFSEPTTPLRGFTRDPPHPQLGGGRRLPPSPGRRHPMSSAFENPDKGPACSPTRPREPSQGLRGARARMCLRWAPRLVYLLCSPGPRGGSGPPDSRP